MLHFATLFDINYLSRGLALIDSLSKHSSQSYKLFVLSLDEKVAAYFNDKNTYPVHIIRLHEIEAHFPKLVEAKKNRSTVEYYFTLSPYLPLYILETFCEVNQITTMDADLYFFDDPALIFNKYPDASVLITPHNFSADLLHLTAFGKYNVSFQSFKRDEPGMKCLKGWCADCLAWCHDYYDAENNRFADQKYLDRWEAKFSQVQDINMPEAGLAPWNIESYNYSFQNGHVLVNGQPLIYFHFHQLRIFNTRFAFNGLELFKVNTGRQAVKTIYHPYLKKLSSLAVKVKNNDSNMLRNSAFLKHDLIQKLKDPTGYWFFNRLIIIHVNLPRFKTRLKNLFRSLWPA